jgi:hypothetical protein
MAVDCIKHTCTVAGLQGRVLLAGAPHAQHTITHHGHGGAPCCCLTSSLIRGGMQGHASG